MGEDVLVEMSYEILDEKPYIPEDRDQNWIKEWVKEERNGHVLYNHDKDDFIRGTNGLIIYFTEYKGLDLIKEVFSGKSNGKYGLKHTNADESDLESLDIVYAPYAVYILLEKSSGVERWGAYYDIDFSKTDRLINWINDDDA